MTSTRNVVRLLALRDTCLSVQEVLDAVEDPGAGGVVSFTGLVRDSDGGRDVTQLEYEAHPDAGAALERVARAVAADLPVLGLAAVHRTGLLEVGDLAVVVAASAPHRAEAFEGARRLIDDLKAQVPVWKRQVFADGDEEWVGTP
ncbi:MAG: molybdenum cofactor biosynthesis protein MoaE [Actinomycetota bacterium]|nr:molybdenum cofactor biosynthesis protein MoaE [Actinomycetota bacterium]